MFVLTKIVLLVLVNVLSTTFALRSVSVLKCCKKDEVLTSELQCAKNESSSWNLRMYNRPKQKIEQFLTLPTHWKIIENTKPNCVRPIKLLFAFQNNFPFTNGSLWSVEYDRFFHPDQFCLDYNLALACIEPERITSVRIKKCCGDNAIFSLTNKTCIHFRDDSYKIDVGQDKTLGAGRPECSVENKMQIIGELHKSEILNNGSLLVDKTIFLPAGKYCLEHVLEHTGKKIYKTTIAQTISRRVRQAISESGIDTAIYSGYYTRHISNSAALRRVINIESISEASDWSNTFYNIPVKTAENFIEGMYKDSNIDLHNDG